MLSLHSTHPSAHTPRAAGSRQCGARESCWGFGTPPKGLTPAVDNFLRSRDSNPQTRATKSNAPYIRPWSLLKDGALHGFACHPFMCEQISAHTSEAQGAPDLKLGHPAQFCIHIKRDFSDACFAPGTSQMSVEIVHQPNELSRTI